MSKDFISDIKNMHSKFGVNESIRKLDKDVLTKYLQFRLAFLREELDEGYKALEEKNGDDFVDSMIDLIVVAVGTLDALDVNIATAWDSVHDANMSKVVGVKPSRPNPLGLPDLIKPSGWVAPSHSDNIGLFIKLND